MATAVAGLVLFRRALGSDADVAEGGDVETSALDGLSGAMREELKIEREPSVNARMEGEAGMEKDAKMVRVAKTKGRRG